MRLPRAWNIVRHTSGLSAVKLLLAAARQTRPWLRAPANVLLNLWAKDGRISFEYLCFGKRRAAFLRAAHLDSDLQSALELAVADCYRLARLPEPDLVVDGGANTGMFALAATARWPNAKIIAFEPVPDNLAVIDAHLAMNGVQTSVEIHRSALSAKTGTLDFYLREANQGSFDPRLPRTSKIEVPLESLRTVLRGRHFERLLIKLDIEGAECDVLADLFRGELPGQFFIVMELHDIARNRTFVESLAREHNLDLEFFEIGLHTGHCQLTSRTSPRKL